MANNIIVNELPSRDQQVLLDKLCGDYRRNLIRKFQENTPRLGDLPSPPSTVLGANALIAEHLNSHGYFLSQSVFSSEIEFPCHKEHETTYRLKQSDVEEIVGALKMSVKIPDLMDNYQKNSQQSLLTTLLLSFNNSSCTEKKANNPQGDLIAFNKYLKILVSRIAKVSAILTELKRKRIELNKPSQRHQHKSPRSRYHRREASRIHDLAQKIEKLSNKLSFIQNSSPLKTKTTTNKKGDFNWPSKSYRAWIKELKDSAHGQRMIRRIERIIVNSLNKEQAAMQRNFDEKLETQKMILKLHYKQKFLEHFQALNLSNELLVRHATNGESKKVPSEDANTHPSVVVVPSRKTRKRTEKKQKLISDKISSTTATASSTAEDEQCKENRRRPLNSVTLSKTGKEERGEGNELKRKKDQRRGKEEEEEEQRGREIRLKNVERLINDAKDRIKYLQSENERLDQSFNTYLEQQCPRANVQRDVSTTVWASYNVDRLLLAKKRHQEQSQSTAEPQLQQQQTKLVVPEIRIENNCKSNLEVDQEEAQEQNKRKSGQGQSKQDITTITTNTTTSTADRLSVPPSVSGKENSSGEFSNPFINFDVKKFLESTRHEHQQQQDKQPYKDSQQSN